MPSVSFRHWLSCTRCSLTRLSPLIVRCLYVFSQKTITLSYCLCCIRSSQLTPYQASNLFTKHIPILFLKGMAFLHTVVTPDLDIVDLVCFAYPCDVMIQVVDEQLAQIFATLLNAYIGSQEKSPEQFWKAKMRQSHCF